MTGLCILVKCKACQGLKRCKRLLPWAANKPCGLALSPGSKSKQRLSAPPSFWPRPSSCRRLPVYYSEFASVSPLFLFLRFRAQLCELSSSARGGSLSLTGASCKPLFKPWFVCTFWGLLWPLSRSRHGPRTFSNTCAWSRLFHHCWGVKFLPATRLVEPSINPSAPVGR
jgi:hypothetical protein